MCIFNLYENHDFTILNVILVIIKSYTTWVQEEENLCLGFGILKDIKVSKGKQEEVTGLEDEMPVKETGPSFPKDAVF